MEATIPECVKNGDVLYTPPKTTPHGSVIETYMDNTNRVRIKRPSNPNFRINKYPEIGHALVGSLFFGPREMRVPSTRSDP